MLRNKFNPNFISLLLPSLLLGLTLSACSPSENSETSSQVGSSPLLNSILSPTELEEVAVISLELDQAAALRAIKRLEHSYAHLMSEGRWQDAAALFASDAVLVQGESRFTEAKAISAWLQQASNALPGQGLADGRLFQMFLLSPVLNLEADGLRAAGRWRQIVMQGNYGANASWNIGINENNYVFEDGEWKFGEFHHYPLFAGSYASGWRNIKEEAPGEVVPVPFHYDVRQAGMPALEIEVDAQDVLAVASMDETYIASLEARSQVLLDEDAIISLQNAFGYYQDRKMWDDLADLFHPQASFEFGASGVYQGQQAIRQALEQFGPAMLASDVVYDHVYLQPLVNIAEDAMSAQAIGSVIEMLGQHEQDSRWGVSYYHNSYVKSDGKWLLESVQLITRMASDYDQGWGLDAQSAPSAKAGFEADLASTKVYQPYPKFDVPSVPLAFTRSQQFVTSASASSISIPHRVAELARQVKVLDAYVGTANVANAYGYSIDEFLWDDMSDLFAIDGWKELSNVGRYTGRERIRSSVVDRYGRGGRRANSMTFHQKTQPVITVSEDGLSSSIRTRLFQWNSSQSAPGSYMSGIYEDTAVKENGVWKLASMDLDYTWSANYIGGWEHKTVVPANPNAPAPGSNLSGDAAPDAPLRGLVTPPYPSGPVDMAFHYANPVSGRAPPILLNP